MSHKYSKPIEELIAAGTGGDQQLPIAKAKVLVVGSGYGASVATLRCATALDGFETTQPNEFGVLVLERGKEYLPGEFPNDFSAVPAHLSFTRQGQGGTMGNEGALFEFKVGDGIDALVGNGLGGTSLINANVAVQPEYSVFQSAAWPRGIREDAAKGSQSSLEAHFAHVRQWLGANETVDDTPHHFPKKRAFEKFALSLGAQSEAAQLAITLDVEGTHERTNAAGLQQPVCTNCGNCVTGCNVGAKNTLAMNLIPAAALAGAAYFTGAEVVSIEPSAASTTGEGPWLVKVSPTYAYTRARARSDFYIEAERVVLGAGTFGSTEILARSKAMGGLPNLSDALGQRFSGNGDILAGSFAGSDTVDMVGVKEELKPSRVGPTITSIARPQTAENERFTLEDGAIPFALSEVHAELTTTAAFLQRMGTDKKPAYFDTKKMQDTDLIALHEGAVRNSQLFLGMCQDHSWGHLAWSDGQAGDGTDGLGRLLPVWPKMAKAWPDHPDVEEQDVMTRVHRTLMEQDCQPGLAGGQFIVNPMWKPVPDSITDVMSGDFGGGRLTTVHPLGGCAMADHPDVGVVNEFCQVFRVSDPAAKNSHPQPSVYPGLYVMDGSVVPEAIGTNPFLTISALSWRASAQLVDELATDSSAVVVKPVPFNESVAAAKPAPLNHAFLSRYRPKPEVQLLVKERLYGNLELTPALKAALPRTAGFDPANCGKEIPVVLDIETFPNETDALILGVSPVHVSARLSLDATSTLQRKLQQVYGGRLIEGEQPIASTTDSTSSTVTLAMLDRPGNRVVCRMLSALVAFVRRREGIKQMLLDHLPALVRKRRIQKRLYRELNPLKRYFNALVGRGPGKKWSESRGMLAGFRHILRMHSNYRRFDYDLELKLQGSEERLRIKGHKLIAWKLEHPRMWDALLNLRPKVWLKSDPDTKSDMSLTVDVGYLLDNGMVKALHHGDVPAGMLKASALGMRFARAILESSFWEFGAPSYPTQPVRGNPEPPEQLEIRSGVFALAENIDLFVPEHLGAANNSKKLRLKLTRYAPPLKKPEQAKAPVVLIHGLAQGSNIFHHHALEPGLAVSLLRQGYDVWLLDYRLSNRFSPEEIPYSGWAMDEIGEFDVPQALHRVFDFYGQKRRLNVFAHCVGAVGVEMAILRGLVTRQHINSVVLNAIHPWVIPSPANKMRAKLGVFARDIIGDELWDPIPQQADEVSAVQTLVDRWGHTFARMGEGQHSERKHIANDLLPDDVCDRMTFLYGRMWEHDNVDHLHFFWPDLVGRAPGAVVRHLYYLLTHERLLDRNGVNRYLKERPITSLEDGEGSVGHWQGIRTLFLHGEISDVFSPASASRSAESLNRVLMADAAGIYSDIATQQVVTNQILTYRVIGQGHMDVILGKDAEEQVFSYLPAFFEDEIDYPVDAGGQRLSMYAFPSRFNQLDKHNLPTDDQRDTGIVRTIANEQRRRQFEDTGSVYFSEELAAAQDLVTGPILRSASLYKGKLRLRYWSESPQFNTSDSVPVAYIFGPGRVADPFQRIDPTESNWVGDNSVYFDKKYQWTEVAIEKDEYQLPQALALAKDSNTAYLKSSLASLSEVFPGLKPRPGGVDAPWLKRLVAREAGELQGFHFIVGSCRYPEIPMDADISEGLFSHMQAVSLATEADALFFIGDQIYADATAGLLDPESWQDRYVERYRRAFAAPALRKLMTGMPTHFVIDDHELGNNFHGYPPVLAPRFVAGDSFLGTDLQISIAGEVDNIRKVQSGNISQEQFEFACAAAKAYMGSGRGLYPFPASGSKTPPGGGGIQGELWGALDYPNEAGCPTFLLDTRSQRQQPNQLMNQVQQEALEAWLIQASTDAPVHPKFIFSGSVLTPIRKELCEFQSLSLRDDGLVGYPAAMKHLLEIIQQHQIQNVVLVGGDLHFSAYCRMTVSGAKGKSPVVVHQVVASGLYVPVPFINEPIVDYQLSQTNIDLGPNCSLSYHGELLSEAPSQFMSICADVVSSGWKLQLETHEIDCFSGQAVQRIAKVYSVDLQQ